MIRLCLDDNEYLSSANDGVNFDNPLESGHIHGNYYGSSTRISGGEIWHPQRGYIGRKISIQVKLSEDKEWSTIFEKYVNFQEESIKYEDIKSAKWINVKNQILAEGKEPETEKFVRYKNKTIQGIRDGTICNIRTGSKITISNESFEVTLFFRDLHRYEGEVQISGCGYKLLHSD
jgi:hypothetical protein